MMTSDTPSVHPLVVFTDLDGTLIDHHTYAADGASEALHRLKRKNVPLVFCSSKTFSEQRRIQQQLGIVQPFIVENGSAIFVPEGYFPSKVLEQSGFETLAEGFSMFRLAHAGTKEIRSILAGFQQVKGFADTPDADLSTITGLSGAALQQARERWFTETIITPLNLSEAESLSAELSASGFTLSRGGRFYTIQSKQTDKGKAVRLLAEIFRTTMSPAPVFAAVGDSPNDRPMLAAVDHAFLVQKYDGTWTDMDIPGVHLVPGIGPAGFSEAVTRLLK